jgi:predicted lipoprotein with Yx(FWY)xxD motif
MRNQWWMGLTLAAAAALLAACSGSSSPASSATSGAAGTRASSDGIRAMTTSRGTVLVSANGLTLYWFAKDTARQSNCSGSCAAAWLPLTGKVVIAPGTSLPHGFGTIARSNGQKQVTYDGHPLYTYTGDRAAGMVTGNGLNLSGGLWWAVTPSGAELPAAPSSGSDG